MNDDKATPAVNETSDKGADVDLERRKLLQTAWIAPVAVTLASMNPSALHAGAPTTGLPKS